VQTASAAFQLSTPIRLANVISVTTLSDVWISGAVDRIVGWPISIFITKT
jgi:hypothetical protein